MALEAILKNKRAEVKSRESARPLEGIAQGLARSERSLEEALSKGGARFIFECKHASPSAGTIRRDFDAAELAKKLAPRADAISVLADSRFFGGSLDDVRAVRDAIELPVLCKDFIVTPYQVYEARSFGADAILLILAALGDEEFASCFTTAQGLGMDVLAEVHDEAELARALKPGAKIIGINSRDLKTLKVDLGTVERLAPLIPAGRIVVAESGIGSHADVRRLAGIADAFLVGTRVMKADDPQRAASEIIHGRIKVCGLTRTSDAIDAARAGATFGGLIFAAESPRCVKLEDAKEIRGSADLSWVGVFADDGVEGIAKIAGDLQLFAVQLHGEEDAGYIADLKKLLPAGCEIWKAHRVRDRLPDLDCEGARVLLDTFSEDARGGTGQRFDWGLLEGADLSEVVISGGLSPANAARADSLGAYALDVNSGVESAPGIKDAALIKEFLREVRHETGRKVR